jgi:hypothetical protein
MKCGVIDPRTIGIGKFGRNADLDTAAAEDIWSYGGVYTFLSAAATLYLTSSDNADTMTVSVTGITAAGLELTQTKILTGQTPVALDTDMLRVYRAYIVGAVAPAGDIYLAESDTYGTPGVPDTAAKVKLKIDVNVGQTLMAITSIPATVGTKTIRRAWIVDMLLTVLPATPAATQVSVDLFVRAPGGIFLSKSSLGVSDTQPILYRPFTKYIEVLPFSDIKMTATTDKDDADVSGEFTVFYEAA